MANAFSPQLSSLALKLKERSGSKKRVRLELVACEHHVRITDLERGEMQALTGAKVIAVLWKGQEGDKAGLIQIAVPVFLHNDGAMRQEAEVVTAYVAKATNTIDGWIEVLAQNDGELYRPFVSMGLATIYQKDNDFAPAWMALCDSRVGLSMLLPSTLRPSREMLDSVIAAPLVQTMHELETAARKLGRWTLPPCSTGAMSAAR